MPSEISPARFPVLVAALGISALVFSGCTTKNYVREQTTPLMNHVNQLDAETAKNTNDIKTVDQNTQAGLAQVNQASQAAEAHAQQVQTQTQQVNQQLTATGTQIQALDSSLANLDNYTQNYAATVHFAFDKDNLTPESQQTLDDISSRLQQDPHGILEVEGYTDSTGPSTYNDGLSQRRADSVVRYLESKNVPAHRIFLVGLGENQAVAPNTTVAGRKENRRVDMKIMDNGLATQSAANGNQ